MKRIVIRIFLFNILFGGNLLPIEESYQEDPSLLKTMESALGLTSDSHIIQYLKKIKKMPDSSWERVIHSAMNPTHYDLRNYLFTRFSLDIPVHEIQTGVIQSFTSLCKLELQEFIKKEMPSEYDVSRIILVLQNVKKRKIRELLPETTMLIAYSLHNVRKAANEAIYEIKDDRLFPIILNLAQSENPVERTYAVDALYYIKDERTTPILIQLLNDKNKSVRYYAIRSLDVMNVQEAIPYYIRILRSDANDEVRILSAKTIQKLKPPMAFNSLLETIYDPNPQLRNVVLDALSGYGFSAAAIHVSKQLSLETDKELKIKEIKLLIDLNNSGYMTGLARILKEENDINVRLWAIYATGILMDQNGYELLLFNLEHENPFIREEAALALANFKIKKSVPNLVSIIMNKSENYNVQAAALFSLKNLDENSSIPDIYEESIKHSNLAIRAEIKKILKDMINKRFR